MMVAQRVISRLDLKNGRVIKGIQLEGQRIIGDPIVLSTKYYLQGVDEILLMDSVASLYQRDNLFSTLKKACESVFVPITIGGGIRSLKDVKMALHSGADKVSINTGLVHDPPWVAPVRSFTAMLFVQALDGPASLRFLSALFKSREPGCDPPDIVA